MTESSSQLLPKKINTREGNFIRVIIQTKAGLLKEKSNTSTQTEKCRESMSMALLADVPSTITSALDQIDENSKVLESNSTTSVAVGPFCVFNANAESSADPTNPGKVDFVQSQNAKEAQLQYEEPMALDAVTSFHFSPESIDFLHWSDLFTWDTYFLMDNASLTSTEPTQTQFGMVPESTWGLDTMSDTYSPNEAPFVPLLDPSLDVALCPPIDLMIDAPLLLGHFNDHVIDQMGSLPIHEKSPWRTLSLPSATITLSQLTLLATERTKVKHANLSNFYAIIAVSAPQLSLQPMVFEVTSRSPGHWKAASTQAYKAAKQHLKLSLETEHQGPIKAKYKQQLMAIHAILATCVSTTIKYLQMSID